MRTLLGTTAAVLARRGIALERLAQVTLRRDAYAEPPGPTCALAIGERTTYRAGAWLLDEFDRAALGASYPAWGGAPGLTLEAGGVTAAVGPVGMTVHTAPLPRDPWAAVVLAALAGPSATVGILLRAAAPGAPADGYRILATSTGQTILERLTAGVAATLATVPTTWRPGQVLRVELAWDRLRVYQEPALLMDVLDPGLLLAGRQAGLVVGRATPGDAAAVAAFVGGELRQEYLGAGLDLGDVATVLGSPVAFTLTLSNVAPMGGAERFAALLRHGLNTAGTFDLDRGTVRLLTAIAGGTAPLTAAVGQIDAPSGVTEDRARLEVRGRDAFLTPHLDPGPVRYLPGPPPSGLDPLPPDPCAPAAPPILDPGPVPPEPPAPPPADGLGPEHPAPLLTLYHYGRTYHRIAGHIGPGNNFVQDTEELGAVGRYQVLEIEHLDAQNQDPGPPPLTPGQTYHTRDAAWYVWRSRPGGLGTHLKVTVSGVYGGGVNDYGSAVRFWGLPYPPPAALVEASWVDWADVLAGYDASATYLGKINSLFGFQPPEDTLEHPPTDFGPLVAEIPIPFETATVLALVSVGAGHPQGTNGTLAVSIIDAEWDSPVPVIP